MYNSLELYLIEEKSILKLTWFLVKGERFPVQAPWRWGAFRLLQKNCARTKAILQEILLAKVYIKSLTGYRSEEAFEINNGYLKKIATYGSYPVVFLR